MPQELVDVIASPLVTPEGEHDSGLDNDNISDAVFESADLFLNLSWRNWGMNINHFYYLQHNGLLTMVTRNQSTPSPDED